MPVVRFRDGSLVVPTRVTTSDGSVGNGEKRSTVGIRCTDDWLSYCERHPEDVVERRARFGETGEDLMDGLGMALAGFVLFLVLGGGCRSCAGTICKRLSTTSSQLGSTRARSARR